MSGSSFSARAEGSSATLYVGEGQSFSTIQAAIDAAQAGDTVIVSAGTYAENVVLDEAITLRGANAGIAGTGERGAETIIDGTVRITAAGAARFDGFEILHDDAIGSNYRGVTIGNANGHVVTNSVFLSSVNDASNGAGGYAVFAGPLSSGEYTISDNLVTTSLPNPNGYGGAGWARGVWSDGNGASMTVTGNTFYGTRTGINLDGYTDGVSEVSGNTFKLAGTAISVAVLSGVSGEITNLKNNVFEAGSDTDFNLRNIPTKVTFDAGAAGNVATGAQLVIVGGNGADALTGTAGADLLDGNTVAPNAGDADTLRGMGGDDVLIGRGGADTLDGGTGIDTAVYGATATLGRDADGHWTVTENGATDLLTGIEKVTIGTKTFLLVDTVGDDGFATIQAAIDAAATGDTVLVSAGTYAENVVLDEAITLRGANAGIAGTGERGAETIIDGTVRITAAGAARFDGFEILHDDAAGTGYRGLVIGNANGHVVTNSVFLSSVRDGGGNDAWAVFVGPQATGSYTISDNLVTTSLANPSGFSGAGWGRGIWSDGGGADVDITGNTFFSTRTGMNLNGYADATHEVSGNTFKLGGTGIAVSVLPGAVGEITNIKNNVFEAGSAEDFNLRNIPSSVTFDAGATGNVASGGLLTILGGNGADTLTGTAGADLLDGNNLAPSAGDADTLRGMGGDDVLIGRGGSDTLDGGTGIDTAVYGATATIGRDADGHWTVTENGATDLLTGIEKVTIGTKTFLLVDTVGDDGFATIQAAIDAAATGDTVLVSAGTYAENLTIAKSGISLLSEAGRASVTITAAGTANDAIYVAGASNVTIGSATQGFTIVGGDGPPNMERSAITLAGVTGLSIVGNELVARGDGALTGTVAGVSNTVISGNLFSGQSFLGEQPAGTSFGDQFTVPNVPRQAVVINGGTNVTFTNNEVTTKTGGISSTTGNPFGNQLVTIDASNSTISGNTFTGVTVPGAAALRVGGNNQTVTDNLVDNAVQGSSSAGIILRGSVTAGTFSGNTFNGGAGNDAAGMTPGNDLLKGNGGNDTLNGGAGEDTVVLAGPWSGYTVTQVGSTYRIVDRDLANGDEGTDTVSNIERIAFKGTTGPTFAIADAVNDAPVVANAIGGQTSTEDAAFTFTVPANTFTDADAPLGDTLTYSAVVVDGTGQPLATQPSWLAFDAATGTFSGTPDNDDVGAISVKVTATDVAGATASSTFTLTVANVNDAPTGMATAVLPAATENTPYTISRADLVQGFTDVDANDTLSVENVATTNGTAVTNSDGSVTVTPAAGYEGRVTLTYSVVDGQGGSAPATLSYTVEPRVLHVGNGQAFATIQAAIDASASGDTILVSAGTYAETLSITKSGIALLSEGGRGTVTITAAGTALDAIRVADATNVTIGSATQGFTIIGGDGPPAVERSAITLTRVSGLTIVGNELVARGDAALTGEGGGVSNSTISGNLFSGQTFLGTQPAGSAFSQQFTLENVPRQAIVFNGGTNITFTDNVVATKTGGISSTTGLPFGNQVMTIDASNSTISGNTFTGFTVPGAAALRVGGNNQTVTDNLVDNAVQGSGSAGVVLRATVTTGTFSGNTFNGSAGNDAAAMTPGNDVLKGNVGNDVLQGGAGADTIDGGAGIDTVVFGGERSNYSITKVAGGLLVQDKRAGAPDGADTVSNVETFRFLGGEDKPAGTIQSTFANETLAGTSGRDVFLFDTALGLGLGADVIRGFAAGDRLVTTTQLASTRADNADRFKLPGLEAGDSAGTVRIFAGTDRPVTSLTLVGIATHEGVSYYSYKATSDTTAGTGVDFGDTTPPTLSITSDKAKVVTGETATLTLTFSEVPQGLTIEDVQVESGSVANLTATSSPTVFKVVYTPAANVQDGAMLIQVGAGSYTDEAGNAGGRATLNLVVDTVPTQAGAAYTGTAADNTFTASTGQNWAINGLGGNDTLTGNAGNDTIDGGDGNDRLAGRGGNDEIRGGAGIDTAVFSGKRGDYTVTKTSLGDTGLTVATKAASGVADGTDTLFGIETFVFEGGNGAPVGAKVSTFASETLAGVKGTAVHDVFFFDTALGLALGVDTITNFGFGDRVVTTSALMGGANSNDRFTLPGTADDGVADTTGTLKVFTDSSGIVSRLKLVGSPVEHDGVTYYSYAGLNDPTTDNGLVFA